MLFSQVKHELMIQLFGLALSAFVCFTLFLFNEGFVLVTELLKSRVQRGFYHCFGLVVDVRVPFFEGVDCIFQRFDFGGTFADWVTHGFSVVK
jgi:hypothetical protein